ncbi:MAG TPA: LysE family translocator, partial [Hyphomicrobiales bacterium]|nr:LysE family translocator [Hyphomicrobiales bacterium]
AALGQGRKAALMTVLGVATGMIIWAIAVAFGLAAVVALFPSLMTTMKILGGGYLCYLAFKALQAAWKGDEATIKANRQALSSLQNWQRGLLVIMTNPKAALMWTAVATFLFGAGLSTWAVLSFGPVAFTTALMIYGSYGLLFSSGLAARAYTRFARYVETLLGVTFGTLGCRLITDGLRDLQR